MTLTAEPVTVAPADPGRSRFRGDIDGLRAVAILLVVGYHAGVPGLAAGFVGVDVFFVISGFLITTVLLEEMDRSGTVDISRFWARRARRLVPAASVVTVCTLVAGTVVLSPLDWKAMANEGLASTTYWSNVLFGLRASDYFATATHSSPFLHTWSLSVEEQFYLVWPVLLLVVLRLGRASGADVGRFRLLFFGCITVASFGLSVSLAGQNSPWGFFSSAARAWEIGAGALLAVAAPTIARSSPPVRRGVGIAGLGLLVAAVVAIDGDTPFPGTAAALPVLGTVAVIAGGTGAGILTRLLSAAPVQAVGRLSYSWYLWHWPVLVLGVAQLGSRSTGTRVALGLVSLVPAALTHRFVEKPIRNSPTLAASWARTLGVVALVMAVALGAGVLTRARAGVAMRDDHLRALAAARDDRPPLPDACARTDLERLLAECVSGDHGGTATILVIGDSHAAQWLPAIDGAARQLGARVVGSVQGDCPSLGVAWTGELPSCGERRGLLPRLVAELRPDLVLVSHSVGYIGGLAGAPADRQLETWTDGLARLAGELRDAGISLGVILDTPRYPEEPVRCLDTNRDPVHCAVTLAEALDTVGAFHAAEVEALLRAGHGSTHDPLSYLCDGSTCPVVSDGRVAYVDTHHLTATYSASLAPHLLPFLQEAMSGG